MLQALMAKSELRPARSSVAPTIAFNGHALLPRLPLHLAAPDRRRLDRGTR
jgi:hypothetical protein